MGGRLAAGRRGWAELTRTWKQDEFAGPRCLADEELSERFDKVFAVNVIVFWLSPEQERAVIRRLLPPNGRRYLFYEPFS